MRKNVTGENKEKEGKACNSKRMSNKALQSLVLHFDFIQSSNLPINSIYYLPVHYKDQFIVHTIIHMV